MHTLLEKENETDNDNFSVPSVSSPNKSGRILSLQLTKMLLLEYNRKEHPWKAFMKDLEKFIKECQSKGYDIIVGGYFNETLEEDNSGIMGLATATNLIDHWIANYPNAETLSMHQEGQKRINVILMSRKILVAVKKMAMNPLDF